MTIFTFANNVSTTLAGPISPSATSLTLSSAAHLPSSIPPGEVLVIGLNDVATKQNFEVIYATSISGATLSGLLRGQEGTTALSWSTGDFAYSAPTAGQQQSFGQLDAPNSWSGINTFTQPVIVPPAVASGDAVNLSQFANNFSSDGNSIFPGGLIIQSGTVTFGSTSPGNTYSMNIVFPETFPNSCRQVFLTNYTNQPNNVSSGVGSPSSSGFTLYLYTGNTFTSVPVSWFATGH